MITEEKKQQLLDAHKKYQEGFQKKISLKQYVELMFKEEDIYFYSWLFDSKKEVDFIELSAWIKEQDKNN